MPFITLTMMLFILACGDKETDMANDTSTIVDTSDDNDESNTPEDTSSEPSTEDTDTEDTETEDTGLTSGGVINIAPSYGSGGEWSVGEIGRTDLGSDIRIPTVYNPDELASPVIWLLNEDLDEWTHTDEDGVYATHPKQGRGLHFVRVSAPSTEEVRVLVAKIARKSERWLSKQGYETNEDWDVEASDALPLF